MKKNSFLILFAFLLNTQIQAQDTLWVSHSGNEKFITYKPKSGEDLFSVAKIFQVPPAKLADINNTNFSKGIQANKALAIPIGPYNYYRINSLVNSKKLYYKVGPDEDLRSISRLFNIPQSIIQEWNDLNNPKISPNQTIQVGWVAYVTKKSTKKEVDFQNHPDSIAKTIKNQKDSVASIVPDLNIDSLSTENIGFENEFQEQTNGYSLNSETGAAVFYPLKIGTNGTYYALADLPKGTIIKVENPSTGTVIYAKIIGGIPKINKYHNAIIGLSGNAANVLSVRDKRFFCRIYYR